MIVLHWVMRSLGAVCRPLHAVQASCSDAAEAGRAVTASKARPPSAEKQVKRRMCRPSQTSCPSLVAAAPDAVQTSLEQGTEIDPKGCSSSVWRASPHRQLRIGARFAAPAL